METAWHIEEAHTALRDKLVDLAQKDHKKFLSVCTKVELPHARQKKPEHFRFRDVYSYNYPKLQQMYGLSVLVNASLVENKTDFIAMEYPTDLGVTSTSSLIVQTQTRVVVSLIGERYHWESDFLREHFVKAHVYTPVEFAEHAFQTRECTASAGYARYRAPLDILKQQDKCFTIEIHVPKKEDRELGKKKRSLFRVNCLHWKDKTPPESETIRALDILYQMSVEEAMKEDSAPFPAVVHCLAGVGRTGTFIFYHVFRDAILNGCIREEEMLSKFVELFIYLRTKRTWMIETPQQLDFLYKIFFGKKEKLF
ncbi:tyrosine-protein phosphatase non-receptor type 2 [Nematocida sp. AWRm77]|nr:tyrosine-protein phosphatase non-receptor type 2 [Nematocida sp. AWRm77]